MAQVGEIRQVAVGDLIPYINNAKQHSEDQVTRIASSIREFGFVNPVLIDKALNIIAGHGRVLAAKKLGMETVPCVYVEGLTDAQRKAYILADNRLGELAEWDMDLVTSELEMLQELDFDIDLTGFELPEEEPDQEAEDDEYGDVDKFENHYGVPYQGNKSRIADIIISILPGGNRLVDLFGGGGAITHCAMLSGKWRSFLYNDINEMITGLFMDAVNGKYHDERRVITREDFKELKDTDAYVKYIWSFGNNGLAYLWGRNIEEIKCAACHALTDDTLNERRMSYKHFVKMLRERMPQRLDLQPFECLQALTQLEALQRLEVSNIDYQDYEHKEGDVVYCDVPYEQTGKESCDDYGVSFDSKKFYEWAKTRPYQVFFSSYEISDDSFSKIKIKEVASLIGATTNDQKRTEYLYSNRPIKDNG